MRPLVATLLLVAACVVAGALSGFELPPVSGEQAVRTVEEGRHWLETLKKYAVEEERCGGRPSPLAGGE